MLSPWLWRKKQDSRDEFTLETRLEATIFHHKYFLHATHTPDCVEESISSRDKLQNDFASAREKNEMLCFRLCRSNCSAGQSISDWIEMKFSPLSKRERRLRIEWIFMSIYSDYVCGLMHLSISIQMGPKIDAILRWWNKIGITFFVVLPLIDRNLRASVINIWLFKSTLRLESSVKSNGIAH